MTWLLDRFRREGRSPTRLEKLERCGSIEELKGFVAECGARGEELTEEEHLAADRRWRLLQKRDLT